MQQQNAGRKEKNAVHDIIQRQAGRLNDGLVPFVVVQWGYFAAKIQRDGTKDHKKDKTEHDHYLKYCHFFPPSLFCCFSVLAYEARGDQARAEKREARPTARGARISIVLLWLGEAGVVLLGLAALGEVGLLPFFLRSFAQDVPATYGRTVLRQIVRTATAAAIIDLRGW